MLTYSRIYGFLITQLSYISNPLIYYWRSSEYRNAMRRVLCFAEHSSHVTAAVQNMRSATDKQDQ